MQNTQARELHIQDFLATHGWKGCRRTPVKGDASFRRYERLYQNDSSAILMDAPPGHEDVRPFIAIGRFLLSHHFSAPEIYAEDVEHGFLLLEDFGDNVYSAILAESAALSGRFSEEELYRHAVEVLVELHKIPPPAHLAPYDEARLLKEALAMSEWYLPVIIHDAKHLKEAKEEYLALWQGILSETQDLPDVLVMRDYHSPNLMWLPERQGIRKVGLLDFQDAVAGSPAYDLVSLLSDARRDVNPELAATLLKHYLSTEPGVNRDAFLASYAILGAQRNLKIIGFVTRKLYSENNPAYLHLFPRMWRYLEQDLKHPYLATVKQWLDRVIPQEARNLDTLTSRHKEQARA